ncbi:O-linked N-acetylglucosamine transferase, SPINDLY family protein [Okeania sp.]|uniref:O-linked N-acetylglucosamine transferase, SPINDLY family protein n=1 Tax=Okeania sp. TaxID=3100323 RepID=UPI002B4B021C|nr:O-linked N-acetylglucosamine transferase, SPINDLY family protein [Okeania sp.]MEB3339607.1 O-linked N-acetylglucosamine transferase, SPINDLY family protein [Okeania sp.]
MSNDTTNWQQEVNKYFLDGGYHQAAILYEQAIDRNPENKSYYWQLGLILLLQGEEEAAQTTWLLGMANGEPEQVEHWMRELIQVLAKEANRRSALEDFSVAWALRQHIREINPTEIENLLHLVDLSISLENYTGEQLIEYGIIDQLQTDPPLEVDLDLLHHVLKKLLIYNPIHQSSLDFAAACVKYIKQAKEEEGKAIVNSFTQVLYEVAYSFAAVNIARDYGDLFLQITPKNQGLLGTMSQFSAELTEYVKAIEYAERSYAISEKLHHKIYNNHIILRAMMSAGGYNQEAKALIERQELLIKDLIEKTPSKVGREAMRLYNTSFFFPYVFDCPQKNVKLRSQLSQACQIYVEKTSENQVNKYCQGLSQRKYLSEKPLKIGYISHCFRKHSVGWIARWLLKHHNQDKFQVYAYLLGSKKRDDTLQEWYVNQVTKAHLYGGMVSSEVAEQIYADEIDVLIDLDSLTLTNSCWIMALKPAPIQVTWLGWDASGVPTIDYYIADPYVLPEDAQKYYSEKIWRLPQTYVAVDGFEVSQPSLRRDNLDIPSDAVVYFTAQRGPKYNPNTIRLQMKILKEVPNSYFLMKGFGNEEFLNELIIDTAAAEGVSSDRIKFTGRVALEEIHRANLQIADVVLDTYPYNGATTTLETLWMCIPMVTKVGQQFAARNSYTMMMNAGITEGIAWSDEEYVEWGIRLGRDENLRKEVSWKLRQSKRTAPLWNAKQFTREMENAYQQMWQIYIDN